MLFGALSYFAALGMSEIVRRGGSGWWVPCGIVCYLISLCYFYESWYDESYIHW